MPKKTFAAVKEAKGELIVQLKENQKTLLGEVSAGCESLDPTSSHEASKKSRNRLESRSADVFEILPCLHKSHSWKKYITSAVRVKRHTKIWNTKNREWDVRAETSYYLCSHLYHAEYAAKVIREHWHIENKNHHVRDVSLHEDASRIRTRPGVFARLRSFALNILRVNQVKNIKAALFENALDFEGLMDMKGLGV